MLISWHSDTSNSTRFLSLYNCFTEAEVTYELRETKKRINVKQHSLISSWFMQQYISGFFQFGW